VVLPVCNLRTNGKAPEGTGWLGCDLDADTAHRLGLVDRVVSPVELSGLIEAARKGRLAPEMFQQTARDERATALALSGLDQFLQALGS
jgi:enoyl-CoA hydratase/carnithine racemase